MGYLPSLGGKAAHLVSDLATVILNPVSERETQRHPSHLPEATEVQENIFDDDDGDSVENSEITNGPDTSSFRAFLMSFMSASNSSNDSMEIIPEQNMNVEYPTLTPVGKGSNGRKGLLSRGKHSIGKIINKAGRIGGFRQKPSYSIDDETVQAESGTPGLELKGSKESSSHDRLPAMSEPSMLLSETMRTALYTSLPVLVQGRNWMLVYSTWRHGISLSTLYRRSMLCAGYSLLIVGDRNGAVFGGLVEAPLQPLIKKKYQGTNNCFVFTNLTGRPVIYRPTGANNYFTFCSTDYLAMGGGGHFALYLDGDLLNGSSSTSETFNNPCLSRSQEFEVKYVELWGFVNASKYDEMLTICRTEKQGIWNL
uniref:TLDc domain-containing protein n=1 Tax=Leersia perrieri TaxID=77586 RepID=A0A0D9WNE4_9ORYZ